MNERNSGTMNLVFLILTKTNSPSMENHIQNDISIKMEKQKTLTNHISPFTEFRDNLQMCCPNR